MTRKTISLIITLQLAFLLNAQEQADKYIWKTYSTEYGDIELPSKGKIQTNCIVADFNNDNIDDFVIFEKTEDPSVLLYTYSGENKWTKSIIERRKVTVGESACFYDIDGDGDLDIAAGSDETNQIWWWENPFPSTNSARGWKRNYIKDHGEISHKDMIFGDFDGDNDIELAFWNQGAQSLFVAKKPKDFEKVDNWPLTKIFSYLTDGQTLQRSNGTELEARGTNYHAGICKADINLDGLDDIVAGGMWFKFENGSYFANLIDPGYSSSRIAAGQLIEGSRPEVVMVSGDGNGPLVLYQFKNSTWIPTILDSSTRRAHTLQLIDFNKDGKLDIFSAEMKVESVTNPSIFILLNMGDGNFNRLNITSNFGSHNTGIGDIDGDGDYDIIAKPYSWDTPRIEIIQNNGIKPKPKLKTF